MKILGIETSTHRASLAVAEGCEVIAKSVLPESASLSASLVPALDALLHNAGVGMEEIAGIAAGLGPGSFTGIRLGLATARGLSLARNITLRGIGSFDILLSDYAGEARRVCPLVDAHSYGCYAALYERGEEGMKLVREPFICQPQELAGIVKEEIFFMGPHLSRFRDRLMKAFGGRASFDDADTFPRASAAARLFGSQLALADAPPGSLSPIYILPGVKRVKD